MVTKKLKYFEYSGHVTDQAEEADARYTYNSFETPNGHVFVIVGNDLRNEPGNSLSSITVERIRYYLDNEVPDEPADAARNALKYANGFVYVMAGNNPDIKSSGLSCICLIIKDRKVYFSWVGQVCLYLFSGKKLTQLNWDVHDTASDMKQGSVLEYLGRNNTLEPGCCQSELTPSRNDVLLLGAGSLCNDIDDKRVRKILSDQMPTHMKALRLLGNPGDTDMPSACQIIQFYNIAQEGRSPIIDEKPIKPRTREKEGVFRFFSLDNLLFRYLLIIIAALAIGYMLYDMFMFDPRSKALSIQPEMAEETVPVENDNGRLDSQPGSSTNQRGTAETRQTPAAEPGTRSPVLPDEIRYTVKSGDTWGKIYMEFGVCSWFIRNHPPNRGKFDSSDNPVTGSEIRIPVLYSSRQRLNPDFYQEFSIDKVGSSCQHANNSFLERFEDAVRRRQN